MKRGAEDSDQELASGTCFESEDRVSISPRH